MDSKSNTQGSNDAARTLEAAGFLLSQMSGEQRQVLTSLSPEEVRTLVSVKERFDAAADVEAYQSGEPRPSFAVL
jgi:hypothetical protein